MAIAIFSKLEGTSYSAPLRTIIARHWKQC